MSDDSLAGLSLAALLGVPVTDRDLASVAVPTNLDAITYRAELRTRLDAVTEQCAAGQQDAASAAADELITHHRAAIAAAPVSDPASDFAVFYAGLFANEEPTE
jgi:hypothetical protein